MYLALNQKPSSVYFCNKTGSDCTFRAGCRLFVLTCLKLPACVISPCELRGVFLMKTDCCCCCLEARREEPTAAATQPLKPPRVLQTNPHYSLWSFIIINTFVLFCWPTFHFTIRGHVWILDTFNLKTISLLLFLALIKCEGQVNTFVVFTCKWADITFR